jgi:hypothetical protein
MLTNPQFSQFSFKLILGVTIRYRPSAPIVLTAVPFSLSSLIKRPSPNALTSETYRSWAKSCPQSVGGYGWRCLRIGGRVRAFALPGVTYGFRFTPSSLEVYNLPALLPSYPLHITFSESTPLAQPPELDSTPNATNSNRATPFRRVSPVSRSTAAKQLCHPKSRISRVRRRLLPLS